MVQITVDIDDELLEMLKKQALIDKSNCLDLLRKFIKQGVDTMSMISLEDDVLEKVNIVVKLTDQTPEAVVNNALRDQLRTVEDVPDDIDYEKIWNMLDHDKPEGDDVLDNLARIGQRGWD